MPAMSNDDLLTAAKIAAQLKVSDAKVKKAIAAMGLKPAAKKGVCNYYGNATSTARECQRGGSS
jgi:hypothetical protein